MKKRIVAIILAALAVMGLFGCKEYKNKVRQKGDDDVETTNDAASNISIEDATTVYQVKSLMTNRMNDKLYSECKDHDDILFYFDLLPNDQYAIVEHDGENYLLCWYTYSDYSYVGTDVKDVTATETNGKFDITVSVKKKSSSSMGCFPNMTNYRLIIRLDKDYDGYIVNNHELTEYNGGRININEKWGFVDKELNIILPIKYDNIFDYTVHHEVENPPQWYRVYNKDLGCGLLDENFNEIISQNYMNIYYVNSNCFIAMLNTNSGSIADDKIVMIDRDENVIKEMDGFLEDDSCGDLYRMDGHLRFMVPYGNLGHYGIMDEDMNIILEPEYKEIFYVDNHYKVTNDQGKEAIFDTEGNMIEGFK